MIYTRISGIEAESSWSRAQIRNKTSNPVTSRRFFDDDNKVMQKIQKVLAESAEPSCSLIKSTVS